MGAGARLEPTAMLARTRVGDERARGEVIALAYDELRRAASRLMRRERTGHTLSPTGVVHEAVIRLLGGSGVDGAADRGIVFAKAIRAMRQVLIEHARRRRAARHGGGRRRVPLDLIADDLDEQGRDAAAIHDALDRLAEWNERQAQVITLRYFGRLTVGEVAEALGVSAATVERDWRLARAWLRGRLRGDDR